MNHGEAVSIRRPFARSAEAGSVAGTRAIVSVAASAAAVIAVGLSLRVALAPLVDGMDDAGYLDAVRRVSEGRPLDHLFPLFRTRVGMAYPLGSLIAGGFLDPVHYWVLTVGAELITLVSLIAAGWLLAGRASAGLVAASLYAIYPLAVQQAAMYYPTAFQVASIASALALIALAEHQPTRGRRWSWGAVAGLALGLGYLFKEDVAIVVPAIVLASLIAKFPRVGTAAAVCAGAAAIFLVECAAYWQTTGQPLFRLTSASGLAAPVAEQLQIAEIWRWDAFLRSLLLLPVQVGLMWWLAIPAAWMAWRQRRSARGVAFAGTLLIIVFAYLQFGSGSPTSYSPLPKTPRYTALATPALMLITGAWLAWLFATRRRLAQAVAAVVVLAALPCIAYLNLAAMERTRNTIAALDAIGPGTLYTDFYSARLLRVLDPDRDIRVWYHADFVTNTMTVMATPHPGAYVLLDHQAAKVYTSSYLLALPEAVTQSADQWTPVWSHRAYADGSFARWWLEAARRAAALLPDGNPLSSKVERSVAEMIDGDSAVVYRVPGATPPTD
jgi:hypothetical protein